MHRMPLTDGAVLEKGCVYVVPLMERLDLPADISAVANAKSSTGPRRLPDARHHR
jgi:dCTP deaminase